MQNNTSINFLGRKKFYLFAYKNLQLRKIFVVSNSSLKIIMIIIDVWKTFNVIKMMHESIVTIDHP